MTVNADSDDDQTYTGPRDMERYAEFLEEMYGDIFDVEYQVPGLTAYDLEQVQIRFEREESHELHQYGVRDTPQRVDITAKRIESESSNDGGTLLGGFIAGLLGREPDPDSGYEYHLEGEIIDHRGEAQDFPSQSTFDSFASMDDYLRYPLEGVSVKRLPGRERLIEAGAVDVRAEDLYEAFTDE